ncbi:MAG: YHS domain-containing (seleno)protein [Bacteroidota bacterium]
MNRIILFLVSTLISFTTLLAQDATGLRKKQFNLEDGIAIQGYDPVAYFKQNKAAKGKKEFALVADGVTYYFSNPENKEAFRKTPAAFEPEYGGWCAYAMGTKGEKVPIDPGTYKIITNKLYLFYNKFFNNTLKDWNKDEGNLKTKADASWQRINH